MVVVDWKDDHHRNLELALGYFVAVDNAVVVVVATK